ncbi:hypothetical protein AB0D57_14790 [Streptomyces sp. NPDC048275]
MGGQVLDCLARVGCLRHLARSLYLRAQDTHVPGEGADGDAPPVRLVG